MGKRNDVLWLISLVALALVVTPFYGAVAKVELSGQVTGTAQALDEDRQDRHEDRFGHPLLNLQLDGEAVSGVEIFVEIHNNDYEDTGSFDGRNRLFPEPESDRETEQVALREIYVTFTELGPLARLTLGRKDVPFGLQPTYRSVTARTHNNPLVGNSLADFGSPETGLHVHGEYKSLEYATSITNGTRRATVEDETNPAVSGSLTYSPIDSLLLKASGYGVRHDNGVDEYSHFTQAEGDPYILDDEGSVPTNTFLGGVSAEEVSAWQVGARYDVLGADKLEITAFLGAVAVEEDGTGGIDDRYQYHDVTGDWSFSDRSGLVLRYGRILEEQSGEQARRWQAGIRHKYLDNLQAKLEYVNQNAGSAFGQAADPESADAPLGQFDGWIAEVSYQF